MRRHRQPRPLPRDAIAADPWSRPVPRGKYFGTFAVQYLVWLGLYLGVNAVTAGRSVLQLQVAS